MANQPLPSPVLVRQLLRYEPDTGRLFWLERMPETVASDRASTRVRICRNWNARFQGQEAFATVSLRGYYVGVLCGIRMYAHRVAWAIQAGEWPEDEIDHINGVRLDNVFTNLREASRVENAQNLCIRSNNTSGHPGVAWDTKRGKYEAYITIRQKRKHLGRFASIDDAIAARANALIDAGFHPNHGRARTTP